MGELHSMETHMKIAENHAVVHNRVKTDSDTGAQEPPIIDFVGIYGPERRRIGQKIAEACETWGFFQLINHGVDETLMKRVKEVFTQFFQLPEEEKLTIRSFPGDARDGRRNYGYRSPTIGDNVLLKATEYLFVNVYGTGYQDDIDRQPTNPPAFRSTVAEYVDELDVLFCEILGLMSEELGLPKGTLEKKMATKAYTMRTNYFQPSQGNDKTWDVPAHTDPSGCTLLLSDEVVGTHVRKDNRWAQVTPIPGALLFNVADQLEILTNGRFKSVEHTGLPHKSQHRLSIATFMSPSFTTVIGPLPELVDESNPPLYKTQTCGSYLNKYYYFIYYFSINIDLL